MDDWARSIGFKELRDDARHNLCGEAGPNPTEEGAATLNFPLAMLLAQFGKDLPTGAKFKGVFVCTEECELYNNQIFALQAAFIYLNSLHAFHEKETLVKDVTAWAEIQSATLRTHGTYVIRLWRKTPGRSKRCVSIIFYFLFMPQVVWGEGGNLNG